MTGPTSSSNQRRVRWRTSATASSRERASAKPQRRARSSRSSGSPGRVPGMDEMARRMAVGTRTLRRQLKAEGTTYQDVVAEFRVAMARLVCSDQFRG